MTTQQVKWAQQHDWFVSATTLCEDGWCIRVNDVTRQPDGRVVERPRVFSDFQQLRQWAGY